MELGDLIKDRRAEIGMTQVRLAELLGRSASTIRSWERGATIPGEDVRPKLARVLGIEASELDAVIGVEGGEPAAADDQVDDHVEGSPVARVHEGSPGAATGYASGEVARTGDATAAEVAGDVPAAEDSVAVPDRQNGGDGVADSDLHMEEAEVESSTPHDREDHTTVMAEGLALTIAVEGSSEEGEASAAGDEPVATSEDSAPDTGPAHGDDGGEDDDTDESEVVDAVPDGRRPRLLGTALSTDMVPELDETQAVGAPVGTRLLSASSAPLSPEASPYGAAPAPQAVILPVDEGSITDWEEERTYQLRRVMTVVALVALLLLLRWSLRGFMDGFRTLKDLLLSNVDL